MSLPSSPLAFTDCYRYLEAADLTEWGVRIRCESMNAATFLRMRMNQARNLDRKQNRKLYPERDHPLHGNSKFDKFVFRLRNDDHGRSWLYIERHDIGLSDIEPLEEPRTALPAPQRPLMLEAQVSVEEGTPTEIVEIRRRV